MIFILKSLYQKRSSGFSLYETLLSTFIIILIFNFSFIKYRSLKEQQSILEAKSKINEAFFYSSLNSLRVHKGYVLKLDLATKEIIVLDENSKLVRHFYLPKNLTYFHTQKINTPIVSFTKNGNISKSFSIYIFDRKKEAKYKISLFGFDKSRFLKINNYKKIGKSSVKLNEISDYNKRTNEDRDTFNVGWKKEN